MAFNSYYKKKRREEKAQKIAEAVIEMQTKVNNVIKESTASTMIVGMHYAYKLLYRKYLKPYEESTDPEVKCQLLCDLAKEVSDKHKSTEAEARAYCEKVGVPYDDGGVE